jgi:16S rRNA (adenine1518-N6/adenine1519-N6)-dimethyltransferase
MHAKKQLGQNFLHSSTILRKIVDAAKVGENDIVLEIGPGKGALTEELLLKAKKVISVEKDSDLIPLLKEKFTNEIDAEKLQLVEGDILDPLLLNSLGFKNGEFKIVANIPYYITGQIFRLFLSGDLQPSSITLVVQKEVAERIVSRDKKESILSLAVKAYGTPKYVEKISARYFTPEPKVDSAIIFIENISRKNFTNKKEEDLFFSILKTGFAHKRKLLIGNLGELFDKELLKKTFTSCSIPEKSRAEEINIEKWLELTKKLSSN